MGSYISSDESSQHQSLNLTDEINIKWYGAAAILLEYKGTKLLFDPYLLMHKKSFKLLSDDLYSIKNILVTHGHFDHIADIPAIFKQVAGNTTIYCTAKPKKTLISKGVDETNIQQIKRGDHLNIGPFEVNVIKGKHIFLDAWLVIKTLFTAKIRTNWDNIKYILHENRICIEAGETVVYNITVANKRILILGSLNLDAKTEYPKDADLLILPFQGRSDINKYAMQFIDRLQPKMILMDHFDDAFPPLSKNVDSELFKSLMRQKYPDIPIICLQKSEM